MNKSSLRAAEIPDWKSKGEFWVRKDDMLAASQTRGGDDSDTNSNSVLGPLYQNRSSFVKVSKYPPSRQKNDKNNTPFLIISLLLSNRDRRAHASFNGKLPGMVYQYSACEAQE
jgi:hypothetical protein